MYMYVYGIEYVSYRLGPYRIRIVSAADRIVPALIPWVLNIINYNVMDSLKMQKTIKYTVG